MKQRRLWNHYRRLLLILIAAAAFVLSACSVEEVIAVLDQYSTVNTTNTPAENSIKTPVPTTPAPAATASPIITAVMNPTGTLSPTAVASPTVTALPTLVTPVMTPSKAVTAAPTKEPTKAPTKAPTAAPTKTPTKAPTKTPTAVPTVTAPASAGIMELLSYAKNETNTILEGTTCYRSEAEANDFFYEMACSNYIEFGLFVEDPQYAHTPEEYLALFPGLKKVSIVYITRYNNGYYFRYGISTDISFALTTAVKLRDDSRLTEVQKQAYEELFTVVKNYTAEEMPDVEKVKQIHDYIVKNCAYDEAGLALGNPPESSYEAEGVLLFGTAVCDGYAKTFDLFMEILGIPCIRVTGTAGETKEEKHAWNAVMLNGEWYHVDATWDDPTPDAPGEVIYTYFLVPDDMMYWHSWVREVICSKTDYLLYPYEHVAKDWEELVDLMQTLYDQGNTTMRLVYPQTLGADAPITVLQDSIRYYGNISYATEVRGEYLIYDLELSKN